MISTPEVGGLTQPGLPPDQLAIAIGSVLASAAVIGLVAQVWLLSGVIRRHPGRGTLAPSVIAFLLSAGAVLALGYLGYGFSTLFAILLSVGFAGSVMLLLTAAIGRVSQSAEGVTAVVGASLAILAGLITAIQVGTPDANPLNTRGACVNTPVQGARLIVRTLDKGQNARSGPATTFPITNRFDAKCLIGVDAYCIGEPRLDPNSGLLDYRWFRIRFRNQFVPAAAVFEVQGVDADLGTTAEESCPGEFAAPAFKRYPTITSDGTLHVELSDGELVGTATVSTESGKEVVQQVGGKIRDLGAPGKANIVLGLGPVTQKTTAAEQSRAAGTLAVTTTCLAVNVHSYESARFFVWDKSFDPREKPQTLGWDEVAASKDPMVETYALRALSTACLLAS